MDTLEKIAARLAAYNAVSRKADVSIEIFSDLTFNFRLEMWGCTVARSVGGQWYEVSNLTEPTPQVQAVLSRFREIDAASPFEL